MRPHFWPDKLLRQSWPHLQRQSAGQLGDQEVEVVDAIGEAQVAQQPPHKVGPCTYEVLAPAEGAGLQDEGGGQQDDGAHC